MKIQPTVKMKPAKKRTRDIFVDRRKVEAIERRESARKYEERKQKLKDFFGFRNPPPVKIDQPANNPQVEEPIQRVSEIKSTKSPMRIFDDNNAPTPTPGFYNDNRGGIQPPKLNPMSFKKKKHPLDDVVVKKPPQPPQPEENVGFLERIKRFFKPNNQEEDKAEDKAEDNAEEYVKSINQKRLNFDYNRSYDKQIPKNVNN